MIETCNKECEESFCFWNHAIVLWGVEELTYDSIRGNLVAGFKIVSYETYHTDKTIIFCFDNVVHKSLLGYGFTFDPFRCPPRKDDDSVFCFESKYCKNFNDDLRFFSVCIREIKNEEDFIKVKKNSVRKIEWKKVSKQILDKTREGKLKEAHDLLLKFMEG